MKVPFTIFFLMLCKLSFAFDIIDDVANNFKNGDVKAISEYFTSTVELSILDQEDIYSSSQAGLILKEFFAKHPPIGAKVIHKVVSNSNYKFGVITLNTSKGNFRISYELKNAGGNFTISEIRIEENKE
ncbi:MAG: DUF4783 domain-containing protein [Bacteroidetes bacterium]|nr:DUF4783 domain-containing protein [Bacteroidota bacterium]MBU1374112.1 DUF4783 domain-containing protein [Bacteroidota bacterium]MBU1484548.1 DUF4783 domain-containing protein [Bacteroidota bacterium]MBU1759243.1 DUF4783 domain-containing protein [Bacteroidota bacterium]MBU2268492.1 DUF4783 domain-containing protein [Bacteroidota bacterium]